MKKRILFIVCITIGGCIAYFITTQKKLTTLTKKDVIPVTTIAGISAPRKITFSEQNTVRFSYAPSFTTQVPESLVTYAVIYPQNSIDAIKTIAKNWGFTTAIKKPVPYVYDWIEKEKHLSFNSQTNALSFAYFYPASNSSRIKQITPKDITDALEKAGLLSSVLTLSETNKIINTTSGEGGGEKEPPTTITSYQYRIKDLPYSFIFTGVNQYAGTIRTNTDGSVRTFSLRLPPTLTAEKQRSLLTVEQILVELNKQKGYLSGASNIDTLDPYDDVDPFSSVEVSAISVGYLFIQNESRFVPIYIIVGTATGNQGSSTVTYYLRATS